MLQLARKASTYLDAAVLLDGALEELVRHVEDRAGAVTGVDLAAAGAAVLHAGEHGESILQQDGHEVSFSSPCTLTTH